MCAAVTAQVCLICSACSCFGQHARAQSIPRPADKQHNLQELHTLHCMIMFEVSAAFFNSAQCTMLKVQQLQDNESAGMRKYLLGMHHD
jgi:hypothetical protein